MAHGGTKGILGLISFILLCAGTYCIGMLDGWYDWLGVFLMLWGNNISLLKLIEEKK